MTVTPYDAILRFQVESEAGEPPYLVDLGENAGMGQCDCPHHRNRIQPFLSRDLAPSVPVFCKHVKAAREFLVNLTIAEMVRLCPNTPDPT